MKRFVLLLVTILLCFSLVRVCLDREPLTLSRFLQILSELDYDFSNTFEVWEEFSQILDFFNVSTGGGSNFLYYIYAFFMALMSVLRTVFAVVVDIVQLLYSVVKVVFLLIGGYPA